MRLLVDVSFSYGSEMILDRVSFEASEGELLAIVGPNGAGKSTLLKCIAGILKPEGRILLGEMDITLIPPRERARLVSYVPQSSFVEFNFTVRELVEMGAYFTGGSVERALRLVGLWDKRDESIFRLSGGEYQLALIARGLAQGGKVMLLDEPTSHLDINHAHEVMSLLEKLKVEHVVVAVLHDLSLALNYADRIVIIKNGKKVWEGHADEVTPKVFEDVYGVRVELVEGRLGKGIITAPGGSP